MNAQTSPITLHGFPRAILHFDGDAFFTSIEQSLHPELRGRPVVTGQERGIIACASYEAKALGIQRGVALHEARRRCPDLVVRPSDYETYSLFSKRMFDIARRFTPVVEEYSIDEGFADLTGLRRMAHASYEEIAGRIQRAVHAELGLTVSAGLSLSKSLAKLCSKFRKPRGFTAVAGYHLHLLLQRTPLEKVWGFGPNTVALLEKQGLRTAYDFVRLPEARASEWLGKIGRELWHELRGEAVYPVTTEPKSERYSVSKCKTFTAPSSDREFVRAQLIRNLESAFLRLREHGLRARTIGLALRRKDFSQSDGELRLSRATAWANEAAPLATSVFETLYESGTEYRSTMVVLGRLEPDAGRQGDLFEDSLTIERWTRITEAVDAINAQWGKHKVSLGASLFLSRHRRTDRDLMPWRKTDLLNGETFRRRLHIPRWAVTV
ncbi:MAG: DNA polymerase IV [Kiritimatiellae bacterium]|nr:DNA polymerase IV [Kiritimatiellia bacterium]